LILIAIALPNFLEARLRATVTQVQAEIRTVGIALESYAVDWKSAYPHLAGKIVINAGQHNRGGVHLLYNLTTPHEYLESHTISKGDPFLNGYERDPISGDLLSGPDNHHYSYGYVNIGLYREESGVPDIFKTRVPYTVFSLGPDKTKGPDPRNGSSWLNSQYGDPPPPPWFDPRFQAWQYSPTNGSRSGGDILRFP
ncbi:MAG: hypothetical protein KC964_24675, partial [Candidatus Omnitrophica bacterium]|nr:hypothetical protein [Candidatus Omnitrophota bacterium]